VRPWLIAAAVLGTAACKSERGPAVCLTWQDDVAPALADCTRCHGGATPAAGYDLTTYLGALGNGSDPVPDAIAGDPTSALVTAIDPATADATHAGQGALHDLLQRWVVACDLAYFQSGVHQPGILDPASDQFHGKVVQAQGWDLDTCARCHDPSKAGAAPACTTCHVDGPTACTTCHGQPPDVGAHLAHAPHGTSDCATCHLTPAAWDDNGHIYTDGQLDPPPAVLTFGDLAATTPDGATRAGPPTFDGQRCQNVYCHGAVFADADARATNTTPKWDGGPGEAACGSCHGLPPANHGDDTYPCATCHPADAPHVDGIVETKAASACVGCHGSAASPAPPTDLAGDTSTTAIGVGAHQAHLQGPHRLRGPVACATCHQVPTDVFDAGHIDSGPPAEVDASLGWDRISQTCATASCHGAARPVWTRSDPDQIACGTCHALPPADAAHDPNLTITDCVTCHTRTVDAFGNIVVTDTPNGPTSEHINGVIDF
jgi:predicted CxxxxCH...CXXCH cytochrome family protein